MINTFKRLSVFMIIFAISSMVANSCHTYAEESNSAGGSPSSHIHIDHQIETLDRGLVAVKVDKGVFLSWRMFITDPNSIGFNLYRNGTKINSEPIMSSTNYFDSGGTINSTYYVRPVRKDGVEQSRSNKVSVWKHNYLTVPIQQPADGTTPDGVHYTYSANDASVGDLDGDGDYEIVLKWSPSNQQDPGFDGYSGNVYLDAYQLNGTLMWRIDLGINIRAGAHTTPFLVFDFDGDGQSEVVVRTSDGAVDGTGHVIGDPNADYRSSDGRIVTGPEYLSVFDGETGKLLANTKFFPARGDVCDWGDCYGNRADRFLAAVAYLDGVHPSIVMTRGYYEKTALAAFNFRNGKLTKLWTFDSSTKPSYQKYEGQGNHNLSIGDIDGDGKDEIVYGAAAFDDDGTPMYSTGLGHGDALHLGNLDPTRPGLEVFDIHEREGGGAGYGFALREAGTGEILWGKYPGVDIGRGMAADIDPRYKGAEFWAKGGVYNTDGNRITSEMPSSTNFSIWWDGDLNRELLDHTTIYKWDYQDSRDIVLLSPDGIHSNNGSKGNPSLQADILGDWREEVIWPTLNDNALRIYTTTDLTKYRIYTLMQDHIYRMGVAWQNVGYNQPPHTSFYLGVGMEPPSKQLSP